MQTTTEQRLACWEWVFKPMHIAQPTRMPDLILVIGGTGAQGFEVVKALLGSEKHFSVRVLSRDPEKARVKEQFKDLPVEVVKGNSI